MNRATIIQAIQTLPVEEQGALLRELLDLLPLADEPLTTPNSSRLAGIFSNGKTPPTDEEVAQ